MTPEFLWTVDVYCDRMAKRKATDVNRQLEYLKRMYPAATFKRFEVFENEQAARSFMLRRAEDDVTKAKKEVTKFERRLKKLCAKFGVNP